MHHVGNFRPRFRSAQSTCSLDSSEREVLDVCVYVTVVGNLPMLCSSYLIQLYMKREDVHEWSCTMELHCSKFDAA